jgi:hypothetical protein
VPTRRLSIRKIKEVLRLRFELGLGQRERDFWEIAEDRYQTRSMILTSQLPVSCWHEQIGDPTLADGDNSSHRDAWRIDAQAARREMRKMSTDRRAKAVEKTGKERTSQERFPLSHSSNNKLLLDDRDHFLQNPTARVASLRRLITAIPER